MWIISVNSCCFRTQTEKWKHSFKNNSLQSNNIVYEKLLFLIVKFTAGTLVSKITPGQVYSSTGGGVCRIRCSQFSFHRHIVRKKNFLNKNVEQEKWHCFTFLSPNVFTVWFNGRQPEFTSAFAFNRCQIGRVLRRHVLYAPEQELERKIVA